MKQLKLMATTSIAAFSLMFLISCGSGKDKATTEATTDTTAAPAETPVESTPTDPGDLLVVQHKVQNFAKWKAGFDAHDSARVANGLQRWIIGRGTPDSNTVIIYMKMADTVKAKAFGMSADLKSVMQKAGVIGAPTKTMLDVVFLDASPIEQTARLIVTSKIKDWDAWKKSYDSHKQARVDAGLIERGVGHPIGDTHTSIIVLAIADPAKAQAFLESKDLKDKMEEAGCIGKPVIFKYNIVEKL